MSRSSAVVSIVFAAVFCAACGGARDVDLSEREGFIASEDGSEMYYRVVGAGDDVVLVPMAAFWGTTLDSLAVGRRVILYDPRGRGHSGPADSTTVSFDRAIRDVESLRAGLGVERMTVIGWSGLARELAAYASRYPGRVTRLIQVGPVPPSLDQYPAEPGVPPREQRMDMAAIEELGRRRDAGEFAADTAALCREVQRLTMPASFAVTTHVRLVPDVCEHRAEWPPFINSYFRVFLPSQPRVHWTDSVRALGIRRLVIHGREDGVPLSGGRAWAAGDPNARLLVLSPSGHLPFIEQRAVFLAAVRRFLDGGWPAGAVVVPAGG
jgi:proline iminopeptidase